MAQNVPRPPAGLRKSGRALWRAVLTDFELEQHETAILTQACRVADLCDTLQAKVDAEGIMSETSQGPRVHPAAVELRQQGIALARLMTALRIPAGESDNRDAHRPGVRGVYSLRGGS
jgi:hypothetical protein